MFVFLARKEKVMGEVACVIGLWVLLGMFIGLTYLILCGPNKMDETIPPSEQPPVFNIFGAYEGYSVKVDSITPQKHKEDEAAKFEYNGKTYTSKF
jgi:hypothetical protein